MHGCCCWYCCALVIPIIKLLQFIWAVWLYRMFCLRVIFTFVHTVFHYFFFHSSFWYHFCPTWPLVERVPSHQIEHFSPRSRALPCSLSTATVAHCGMETWRCDVFLFVSNTAADILSGRISALMCLLILSRYLSLSAEKCTVGAVSSILSTRFVCALCIATDRRTSTVTSNGFCYCYAQLLIQCICPYYHFISRQFFVQPNCLMRLMRFYLLCCCYVSLSLSFSLCVCSRCCFFCVCVLFLFCQQTSYELVPKIIANLRLAIVIMMSMKVMRLRIMMMTTVMRVMAMLIDYYYLC